MALWTKEDSVGILFASCMGIHMTPHLPLSQRDYQIWAVTIWQSKEILLSAYDLDLRLHI